jgi:hypothetical protein
MDDEIVGESFDVCGNNFGRIRKPLWPRPEPRMFSVLSWQDQTVPMAKKGALESKRDILFESGAMSVRPDAEMLRRIQDGDTEAIVAFYGSVRQWVNQTLALTLEKCCQTLSPFSTWAKLAASPKDFDAFLDKMLSGIQAAMKLLYSIPDHRPAENLERDRRLLEFKLEHPDWSYGQLALHYNRTSGEQMTDKAAERAYARQVARIKPLVERAIRVAERAAMAAELSPKELLPHLPTPEDVLDLLTASAVVETDQTDAVPRKR